MKEFFTDFKDPKFWASICAWMVPVSMVVLFVVGNSNCWTISEIGTFIGAVTGPLAGLAGFLYIYASFQVQSKAIALQQDQIDEQKSQFERQAFESVLLKLIESFKAESGKNFPTDPNSGLTERIKYFTKKLKEIKYPKSSEISDLYINEFDKISPSKYRAILALMKYLSGILVYINQSPIPIKKPYYELLFIQLTEAEIRAYFYGYFYEGFDLNLLEKTAFKEFFLNFDGRDLIDNKHINLMKN